MANNDYGGVPYVDNVQNPETARALMESEKLHDWLAKLDHKNNGVATSFGAIISKCLRYGLFKALDYYYNIAISRTSINSRRALLVSQTSIGVIAPTFYDKGANTNNKGRGNKQQNENS